MNSIKKWNKMDDRFFDQIIKEKLEHREEHTFDPQALDALHERLAHHATPFAWHNRYRTELVVLATLLLFTGLNYLLTTRLLEQRHVNSQDQQIQALSARYEQKIDSLSARVRLMSLQAHHDTVYIVQPYAYRADTPAAGNDTNFYTRSHDQQSTATPAIASVYPHRERGAHDVPVHDSLYRLGPADELPPALISVLRSNRLLKVRDQQAYVNLTGSGPQAPANPAPTHVVVPQLALSSEEHQTHTNQRQERALSASQRKALEKHYFGGLGIELAPMVSLVQDAYDRGSGSLRPHVGVSANWIVSPRISFETGLAYGSARIAVTDNLQDLHPKENEWGDPVKMTFTRQSISLPLGIRYRQWIQSNRQLLLRAGYTPYFSLHEVQECSYAVDGYNTGKDYDEAPAFVLTERRDTKHLYVSTVNVSAGLLHTLKNKHKLETTLTYEHGLRRAGVERSMVQFFGVKAAYWFKVK